MAEHVVVCASHQPASHFDVYKPYTDRCIIGYKDKSVSGYSITLLSVFLSPLLTFLVV